MSNSSGNPWSDNPNAPQIPYWFYFWEKVVFTGLLAGAIFYGIVVVLFFQCMGAFFNPVNLAKGGINWKPVVHAAAMFSVLNLDIQSSSYIDNREYPGNEALPPGSLGYQFLICSKAISVVPSIMFILNQWLADGLLLYRCCVIYGMNRWVVAFPCLIYLTSLDSGVWDAVAVKIGLAYFAISPSLNILLTLVIVIRPALHRKNIQNAMGPLYRTGGLYGAVVTMLVESCALYAVNSALYIGPWGAGSHVADIFPILSETQSSLRSSLLYESRTGARVIPASGTPNLSSIHFGNQGKSTGVSGTLSNEFPMSLTEMNAESSGELGIGDETVGDKVL